MVPYIFGGIFVTSFFILYGALLYLNHSKIDSIKEFYKKKMTITISNVLFSIYPNLH